MKWSIVLLSALLVLAAACSPAGSRGFEAGQLEMSPGERLDDVQSGSVLTFVEIVQDSRCPADAICVSSGFVQARFLIEQGEITRDVVLTLGDMSTGDINSVEIGGWTVTLVEVNPYPLASAPVDYADYSITLDLYAD
ncbi:MAG: hypothetical protein KIT70_00575 [Anaerolineales bacterium]|nr:MAG: hypothetical protein KIT70_00575 [Anaerolineales bacterium]